MTWLRAVLAQRHVDTLRADARRVPLDALPGELPASAPAGNPDPDGPRLLAALRLSVREAVAALEPGDRLRLAWYYAHDLTLAEIARLGGEHESTASRKLARTRQHIKQTVERMLRERFGLTDAQVRECLDRVQEIDAGSFLERG